MRKPANRPVVPKVPAPDPRNAHIREITPGVTQTTAAETAQRLLSDPALDKAFADLRQSLVGQIERLPIHGDANTIELERELCRHLRTAGGVQRALKLALQGQTLRDHNFRPTGPSPEEKIA